VTQIKCSDFAAELGNLLDEQVSPELRAHLQAHLAECSSCSILYDSTRKTIRIVTDTETFDLAPDQLKASTERIMSKIRGLKT
jgi:mycothiol system anti-sigma-R factor